MKVAFWSNAGAVCSVSQNLAAISVASVNRFHYSIIAMENRLQSHNLGKAYHCREKYNSHDSVGTNYYDGNGIEGLLRKIYRGDYKPDILKGYLKEIIRKHLYYIPQSKIIHNEIFDYEFDHCIYSIFQMTDQCADICFIDTASNNSLSTKFILEEADLIVINLCQKESVLNDFFQNYSSLIPKAVFIISNYDPKASKCGLSLFKENHIPRENIIAIPYNELYHVAYESGNVLDFINGNYSCDIDNPNYPYMQSVKKATYIIIRKLEQVTRKKVLHPCGK